MLLTGLPEGTALAGTKTSAAVSSPAAVTESADTDSSASASSAPTTVSDVTVNDDGQYEATVSNAKVMDASGTETTFNLRLVSDTDDTTESDFISATQEVAGTADTSVSAEASASSSDSTDESDDAANTGSVILIPGMTADDLKEAAQAEAKQEITSESVSDALSTNVHAASVGESVTLNVGSVVKLNTGHGTHRFTVTDASGSSYYAYCLEPSLAAPAEEGHSTSEQIKKVITNNSTNDNDLTLLYCAYYLYGGPGWGQPGTSVSGGTFDPGQKDQDSYNYLLTHEILSVAYAGGDSSVIVDVGDKDTVTGVMQWYNSIKKHKGEDGTFPAIPDSYTFCVLYNDNLSNKQHMSYGSVRARIVVPIQKVDSQTLEPVKQAGFTFTAYMHQGDFKSTNPSDYGTPIGTVTTDPNGQASIVTGWVGSAASNYTNWLAANRTWTFLIQETGTPNGGKYGLNSSPLRYAFTFAAAGNSYLSSNQHDSSQPWMFWAPDGRIKFGDPKRGRVAINLQKTDASTGKAVNLAGFTFDAYYTQGATTSKNPSDYTLLKAGMPTNASGQIGIATGYVGTAKDTYAEWVKANPKWTFLVVEKSVPAGSGYTLNSNPMTYTVDLTKATADKETAGLYWGKDTANFANTKQLQGKVGIKIQKKDADTGSDVKLAGITFDAYIAKGSTTSTTLSDYTKVGTVTTDANGQATVETGDIGTVADTYADWVKANPTWTFLFKETALPAGSGYALNSTPLIQTVDLTKATADTGDASLYWAANNAEFKNTKQVQGEVGVKLQKKDADTGNDVKLAGITFDVYYAKGSTSSTNLSDYTKFATAITDTNGQAAVHTGKVGTLADTYADWVKANPTWTFLFKETALPAGSGYTLNTKPLIQTMDLTKATADKTAAGLYWAPNTAEFTNTKQIKGHVGVKLQKTDASTGKDLKLAGITFDTYYMEGEPTSTETSKYTKLGTVTTDANGQANIETDQVGTAADTYADWAKANPKWTFLVIEKSVPKDSGYTLNDKPMTITVDLTKGKIDKSDESLYWGADTLKFANKQTPPTTTPTPVPPTPTPTTTPPAPKTPTIKTTATSSGSHDVMLNEKTLDSTTVTISDVIDLANLESGKVYTIKGELHNAETGKQITTAKANDITFTATGDTSTQTMTFTVPAKDVANVKTVVYEKLFDIKQSTTNPATQETNAKEAAQTVSFTTPGLSTSAKSGTTGKQQADALSTKETVVDTVKYTALQSGKSYTVKGTLMLKASDKDTTGTAIATAEKTFTPNTANGSIDLTFTYDATKYVGKTVVAFEELQQGGVTVATHKDLTDTAQSVYIPSIGTKATGTDTGIDHQVAENGKTITDTVSYTNLLPETTYKLAGTLVNKATGKEALKADATFTTGKAASGAATVSGTADVVFKITDASAMEGNTFVAYETLSLGDTAIAEHKDLTDAGQTVYLPKVETQVKSDTTSTQAQFAAKDTKITDTVNVSGLKNGQTYVIKGTLMDKATGKAVAGVTAAPAEVKFTANATTSTQTIQYTFDSTDLEGHVLVVFEDLYAVDSTGKETLVGKEEDLQSKTQAMLLTPHGPTLYAGGTGTRYIYIAGLGLAAVAVILVVLLRKKRKSAN